MTAKDVFMQSTSVQLNARHQAILEIIVRDYVQTASPVASQQIVKRDEIRVSPATIRNDMAELENLGYISRPHTSAGGVPADQGYRYYVDHTSRKVRPQRQLGFLLRQNIDASAGDLDAWARVAVTVLARSIHNVAIVTPPRVELVRVKQIQLVELHERQALLVLVVQEAQLRQQLLRFPDPTSQDRLNEIASALNKFLAGRASSEINTQKIAGMMIDPRYKLVIDATVRLLNEEQQGQPQRPYTDGLRHMLSQPEFADPAKVRDIAALLEDDRLLKHAVSHQNNPGTVQVVIGKEHTDRHFHPYSLVIAQYGVPNRVMGSVGVMGPTRMDYAHVIVSVRYLADFLGALVASLDHPTL
jgi:heat-inducible transcriptional repressor